MELKGDMNLQITDASQGQIKLEIAPSTTDFGSDLQFKQHPKVAKFGEDRIIGLSDSSRSFPIGQSIAVLRWRYSGKDESYLPLSSRWSCVPKISWEINNDGILVNCWPTPSNDGTVEVNMEYELENENVTIHDLVISIPLPYVYHVFSRTLTYCRSLQIGLLPNRYLSLWWMVLKSIQTFPRLDPPNRQRWRPFW